MPDLPYQLVAKKQTQHTSEQDQAPSIEEHNEPSEQCILYVLCYKIDITNTLI